ncbi:hypothetical protein FRC08_016444 [Ceratobasidium sp. 394]|nr:hypothetical protein FRC08_016444 [Ceratobasidium sp. 394]
MVRNQAKLTQGGITVGIGTANDDDHYIEGFHHRSLRLLDGPHIHARECLIPAVAGQAFCIHVSYAPGGSRVKGAGLQAEVCIDGSGWVADVFLPAKDFNRGRCEFEIMDYPVGAGVCPLRFSQREFAENQPAEGEEPDKWWLGTISVRVFWAFEDETPETEDGMEEHDVEKALLEEECARVLNRPLNAAGSEYGAGIEYNAPREGQETPEPRVETLHKIRKIGNEEYHFVFHYRQREWITANGLARHTLSPSLPSRRGSSEASSNVTRDGPDPPPPSKKSARTSKRARARN